jgi:hypothetical protein
VYKTENEKKQSIRRNKKRSERKMEGNNGNE